MQLAHFYWVVQRDACTGAPITFKSFADHAAAKTHTAELEKLAGPQDKTVAVTIETPPVGKFPE